MGKPTANRAIAGLYAITPDIAITPTLIDKAAQAIAGGAGVLQYRNKTAHAALAREQAFALSALARDTNTTFIVNDDIALALQCGADGVHLGQSDGDIAALATLRAQSGLLIGVSCYADIGRARQAAAAGADYVAFGSMFPSATKPGALRASLNLIAEAKRTLSCPVVAIGGITLQNAPELMFSGVDALAVISDLFDSADIAKQAHRYATLFRPPE